MFGIERLGDATIVRQYVQEPSPTFSRKAYTWLLLFQENATLEWKFWVYALSPLETN